VASFVGIYARALTDVVVERRLDPTRVTAELESIATLLETSSELRTIWDTPSVAAAQKLKVLDAIVKQSGFSREVRNFTAVLISNRRIDAFDKIAKEAIAAINDRLGIADAEITTVRDLTAEEKHKLEAQLAKTTGKKLRVRYAFNEQLKGGVVVKVGSTIYDGSIRGQLQRIREQLTAT